MTKYDRKSGILNCLFVIILFLSIYQGNLYITQSIGDTKGLDIEFSGGNGSIENPFVIENVIQLQNMNMNLSAHYILNNDIDAHDTRNWNNGTGFIPIGNNYNRFTGSLDGRGYTISDLYIHSESGYVGLFGFIEHIKTAYIEIEGGFVLNLILKYVDIEGSSAVGALSGATLRGTIINCHVSGSIKGDSSVGGLIGGNDGFIFNSSSNVSVNGREKVGGLCGSNILYKYDQIINCYSDGIVTGDKDIGGLFGYDSTDTRNCYSKATVIGRENVGGLIGYNRPIITPKCCYSTGNVTGETNVGGLVGLTTFDVEYCYSIGSVSGEDFVGGLIGKFTQTSSIYQSSFWDVQTSGQNTSAGGYGKTTSEMMDQNTFLKTNWPFGSVWAIKHGHSYPFFRWNYWNDPPEAIDDHYMTTEDEILVIEAPGILKNDKDPDLYAWMPDLRDNITVMSFDPISEHGAAVRVNEDGSFIYDPSESSYLNALSHQDQVMDTFCYTIRDSNFTIDPATVHMKVLGVNDPPVARSVNYTTDEDNVLNITSPGLLDSTEDPDVGDVLSIIPNEFITSKGAEVSLDADGSFVYDPTFSSILQSLRAGDYTNDIFMFSVRDQHGAESSAAVIVKVAGMNDAPIITTTDPPGATTGTKYRFDFEATDVDNDNLIWSLDTDADWLYINPLNGSIYGTPTRSDLGPYHVNISVTDDQGGYDRYNFTLSVKFIPNSSPLILTTSVPDGVVGIGYGYQVQVFDAEGDIPIWSLETNASWLKMNGTGYLSGTPSEAGIYSIKITVSDGWGGTAVLDTEVTVFSDDGHNDIPVEQEIPLWAWIAVAAAVLFGILALFAFGIAMRSRRIRSSDRDDNAD